MPYIEEKLHLVLDQMKRENLFEFCLNVSKEKKIGHDACHVQVEKCSRQELEKQITVMGV